MVFSNLGTHVQYCGVAVHCGEGGNGSLARPVHATRRLPYNDEIAPGCPRAKLFAAVDRSVVITTTSEQTPWETSKPVPVDAVFAAEEMGVF
jgi:hypothetical protein